jgi:hypothetical protein
MVPAVELHYLEPYNPYSLQVLVQALLPGVMFRVADYWGDRMEAHLPMCERSISTSQSILG